MNTTRLFLMLLLTGAFVPVVFAQDAKEEDVKELGTYTVGGGNSPQFDFDDESEKPVFAPPDISFESNSKPDFKISLPPPGANRAVGSPSESSRTAPQSRSETNRTVPQTSASAPPPPSGPIRQPVPISLPAPAYPRDAARRHIEGYVVVEFTVTATGEITDIEVIRSKPVSTFNREARRAVSQWRYKPGTQGGQPVPMRVQQTIKFDL